MLAVAALALSLRRAPLALQLIPKRGAACLAQLNVPKKQQKYITTPIYYVNGQPHIGHVYTSLACDLLARFYRLDGHTVLFLTGTDEHGQKVEQSAKIANKTPQAFADQVSETFRSILPLYDFSADQFIRTTEPRHKLAAQALWTKLRSSGDIYLGAYEGWYSVRDEAFYGEEELVDGLAPTGAPVEWVAEPSYFFRLSRWGDAIRDYIESNPEFISPPSRRNEVLAFMREGLRDLSISRTTFKWGLPVPSSTDEEDSDSHIMYVWLDALTNYLTAVGYPDTDADSFRNFWPATVHMVGKDILRFHAIYWPAFLLAAGLPLPNRIFAHGWWMVEGQKMSKSIGNVIDPIALVKTYGSDAVRYFMLNEVSFGSDGDFSHSKLVETVNAKLANELGNLAYRTLSFSHKQCGGVIPEAAELTEEDRKMLETAQKALPQLRSHIDQLSLHRYTQCLSSVASEANKYIDVQAPWALRKHDPERMRTVLWVLLETLRYLGALCMPVTPNIGASLLKQLSIDPSKCSFATLTSEHALRAGTPLPVPEIIVPRIEDNIGSSCSGEDSSSSSSDGVVELTSEELVELESAVSRAADVVRGLKARGASSEEVQRGVSDLLLLKSRLPAGHALLGGGAKEKKKRKK